MKVALAILLLTSFALADDAPKLKLDLSIAIEDVDEAHKLENPKVKLLYKRPLNPTSDLPKDQTIAELKEGANTAELPEFPDGDHLLNVTCDGCAPQWFNVKIANHEIRSQPPDITLYRLRYVVMHWAFNKKGGRELSGDDVEEGRLVLTHWRGLPHFDQDWHIWQSTNPNKIPEFGPVPILHFHRAGMTRFGFIETDNKFEDMKTAPDPKKQSYDGDSREAIKGKKYYCRIDGDKGRTGGLGFGKIEIEDVTLDPPKDVEIKRWKP